VPEKGFVSLIIIFLYLSILKLEHSFTQISDTLFNSEGSRRQDHRNIRIRRRMHLCMQDDQIVQKIVGLVPADMARLPPSIIPTKIFLVRNNLVRQLGLHLL
jgi:hypothetical protein